MLHRTNKKQLKKFKPGSHGTTGRHGIMGRLVLWEGMKGWLNKQLHKFQCILFIQNFQNLQSHLTLVDGIWLSLIHIFQGLAKVIII